MELRTPRGTPCEEAVGSPPPKGGPWRSCRTLPPGTPDLHGSRLAPITREKLKTRVSRFAATSSSRTPRDCIHERHPSGADRAVWDRGRGVSRLRADRTRLHRRVRPVHRDVVLPHVEASLAAREGTHMFRQRACANPSCSWDSADAHQCLACGEHALTHDGALRSREKIRGAARRHLMVELRSYSAA